MSYIMYYILLYARTRNTHAEAAAGDGSRSCTAEAPPAFPATAGSDREAYLWLKCHTEQQEALFLVHLFDARDLVKKPRSQGVGGRSRDDTLRPRQLRLISHFVKTPHG